MNLTPDDLQDLLARAMATAMQQVQNNTAPTAGAGAAAIVGRLGPCELGRDKLKRYKRFIDWVGEAESKNTGGSNPYAVIIEEVFGLDKIEFLQVTLLL